MENINNTVFNFHIMYSTKVKEYEIHIYEEMDSLLDNKSLSKQECVQKLERMISELDSLVEGEMADRI